MLVLARKIASVPASAVTEERPHRQAFARTSFARWGPRCANVFRDDHLATFSTCRVIELRTGLVGEGESRGFKMFSL